ncbi:MAG: hypothetical protein AVDCRST_MAG56-4979, partial [uncultured Cytophagales bacterium]
DPAKRQSDYTGRTGRSKRVGKNEYRRRRGDLPVGEVFYRSGCHPQRAGLRLPAFFHRFYLPLGPSRPAFGALLL